MSSPSFHFRIRTGFLLVGPLVQTKYVTVTLLAAQIRFQRSCAPASFVVLAGAGPRQRRHCWWERFFIGGRERHQPSRDLNQGGTRLPSHPDPAPHWGLQPPLGTIRSNDIPWPLGPVL